MKLDVSRISRFMCPNKSKFVGTDIFTKNAASIQDSKVSRHSKK